MSADACVTCCQTAYMTGAQDFTNDLGMCACTSPGTCATQCSAWCSGGSQTAACTSCLETSLGSSGTCLTPVETACSADPACTDYVNCGDGCPM
jgi:hypothetical protein